MAITAKNITSDTVVLSGYKTLEPGETVEMDYRQATRWINCQSLFFDFAGGTMPFKNEKGEVSHINIVTPLHPSFGYGLIGLNAIDGLSKRGIDVSVSMPVPEWVRSDIQARMSPELYKVITRPDKSLCEVGLSHTIPLEFHTLPSPRKVGWSMWEATRLPRTWVEMCKACEVIVVPSTGQVPIFEESGVPIKVVRDASNVENFTLKTDRDLDPEVFTFIAWSRMSSRKCPMETVQCFQAAFPGRKDVRLIMKTIQNMFGQGGIGIPEIKDDRITIINEDWPQSKLVDLCHNAHAGIFLSRGEGSYNPPTQAMATGLPVILSNHSGVTDQCDERYNYPVRLDPVNPYEISPLGHSFNHHEDDMTWWTSDYEQAIELMREVFNNREKAYKKGIKAASFVRKNFSQEQMIDGLISVLNDLK